MGNKVQWGLCRMAYAVITEGEDGSITYGTPVPMPGAVDFSSTPLGDTTEYEADNIIFHRAQGNDGYDLELKLATLPESYNKDVLGETLDSNKVLIETSAAEIKRVAILGQFEGDVHKKRFVFYNCLPERVGEKGGTSRRKDPSTGEKTIKLTADPRLNDLTIKATTTAETNQAIYDAWFDTVYTGAVKPSP